MGDTSNGDENYAAAFLLEVVCHVGKGPMQTLGIEVDWIVRVMRGWATCGSSRVSPGG